jgi:predicted transcriptional regulator
MNANHIMTKMEVTGNTNQTLQEVSQMMFDNHLTEIVVMGADNQVAGVIKDSDFLGTKTKVPHAMSTFTTLFGHDFHKQNLDDIYSKVRTRKIADVIKGNHVTIDKVASLNEVVELMQKRNTKVLVVTDNNKPIGTISYRDLMKAFSGNLIQ